MDIQIDGPRVIFELPIFGGIPISETVVVTWLIMALLIGGSYILTRNMQKTPGKKQLIAESYVGFITNLVSDTMGPDKLKYVSFIATLFLLSAVSSLSSLVGLRAPTADVNTTVAWALLTAFLIQKAKMKDGLGKYAKGFTEPMPAMLPMNIIGDITLPVSLAFRHYGNIISGTIISTLIYGGFSAFTAIILKTDIPLLGVGIPAVLSLYFDLFAGFMQAFIFAMLSMVFIAMAEDD